MMIAVVLTTVGSVVLSLPNVYHATATIQVERQQVPEAFVQSTVTSEVKSRLQTITKQILSPDRLQDLIHRFDLYPDLRQQMPLDRVITRMQQDIQLEQQSSSPRRGTTTTAFTISYRSGEPQKVAQVANVLASFYIEENVKVREQATSGTSQFLQTQLEELRQQLEQQEQRLSQFKERYIGELPEQLNANLATLERLNLQLRLNSDEQARARERQLVLSKQQREIEDAGRLDPATQETPLMRLTRLRQELLTMQTRYGDKHPRIIRLKAEIAAVEQQLVPLPGKKQQPDVAIVAAPQVIQLQKEISAIEVELKTLKVEEQHLLQSIAFYQQRVENTPRREQELKVLARDYDTAQQLYQSLLKRQAEARLAENMEQSQQGEQFRLLEQAKPPSQPAAPNRVQLGLLGLLLALGLATGVVLLVERLDTSFHAVEELRAFSPVPVLLSLPRIVTAVEVRRQRWRFAFTTVSALLLLGLLAGLTHIIAKDNTQLVRLLEL
jgi:polysaccharide chain length determinant protein (PEP-CTERM system associated)